MNKGERISQFVTGLAGGGEVSTGADVAQNAFYLSYFRCWNEQRYYEAHDVLEHLWLVTKSEDHAYFKGLIQAAGAFVHLQKHWEHPTHHKHGRRLAPAARLFGLAERNLTPFLPRRHGLDVAALCHLLREKKRQLTESDFKVNPWSPEKAPVLEVRDPDPDPDPES